MTADVSLLASSLVGDALNPSPYKEAKAEADRLRAENEALRADAERFAWYFGPPDKCSFVNEYLQGVREGWTVDQWRAAIDAARKGGEG